MNLDGVLPARDHVFPKPDGWYFFDKDGSGVGPYKDEETAIAKWEEYQLYLRAH